MGKFAVHCVCFSQRNVNGRSAEAAEARLISCRAKNSRGNVRRRMIAWYRAALTIRFRTNLWFCALAGDNGVEPANERTVA